MDELKKKTDKELASLLEEKRSSFCATRLGNGGQKKKGSNSLVRKEIARILTEIACR